MTDATLQVLQYSYLRLCLFLRLFAPDTPSFRRIGTSDASSSEGDPNADGPNADGPNADCPNAGGPKGKMLCRRSVVPHLENSPKSDGTTSGWGVDERADARAGGGVPSGMLGPVSVRIVDVLAVAGAGSAGVSLAANGREAEHGPETATRRPSRERRTPPACGMSPMTIRSMT